jgi:hypothetical protein
MSPLRPIFFVRTLMGAPLFSDFILATCAAVIHAVSDLVDFCGVT